jgi:hypothetical protein
MGMVRKIGNRNLSISENHHTKAPMPSPIPINKAKIAAVLKSKKCLILRYLLKRYNVNRGIGRPHKNHMAIKKISFTINHTFLV